MVRSRSEANSPTVPAITVSWPKSVLISPASRTTGNKIPSELDVSESAIKRRSAEPDRERGEPEGDGKGKREGDQVRRAGDPGHGVREILGVDVLARQEEEETQAHQVEQLDRALGFDPPEPLRSHRYPEEDLQDNGGQQPTRHQPGQEGSDERHDGDDEEASEVEADHSRG